MYRSVIKHCYCCCSSTSLSSSSNHIWQHTAISRWQLQWYEYYKTTTNNKNIHCRIQLINSCEYQWMTSISFYHRHQTHHTCQKVRSHIFYWCMSSRMMSMLMFAFIISFQVIHWHKSYPIDILDWHQCVLLIYFLHAFQRSTRSLSNMIVNNDQ
jgi:hypothetical protein